MTPEELRRRLNRFPRLELCRLPTPLDRLEQLTRQMAGPQIWIKRDDGIGPGLGGNKGRGLEYLIADAIRRGRRKIATVGAIQSNHTRMTAAACAATGLKAHLLFFERRPATLEGNLLLSELLGARMHFIPLGSGRGTMTIELTSRLVQWLATLLVGGRGYFIPVGGHNVLGALGYVAAALELSEQLHAKGIDAAEATLVFAAGSGTTLAGLLAGFALLDSPIRLLAVDVGALWKSFRRSIARLATNVCAALDNPIAFNPRQVPLVEGRFVGSRYGAPTSEAEEAIRTVARTEGILLDPVYTAKAFAGLLELVKGPIRPAATTFSGEHIIFLHTGGLPALFASLGEQNKTSGSG